MTVFNRRRLWVTYQTADLARVRDILDAHKIDHTVKTVDRTSPSMFSFGPRWRTGTFGLNPNLMYEYIVYVHKSDYEAAEYLIRK